MRRGIAGAYGEGRLQARTLSRVEFRNDVAHEENAAGRLAQVAAIAA